MRVFEDSAALNPYVRLWLPCSEGSGNLLTNRARNADIDTGSVLQASAWNDYAPASGRASVKLAGVVAADMPLISPFSPARLIGGRESAQGDAYTVAAMVRFDGFAGTDIINIGNAGASVQGVLRFQRAATSLTITSESMAIIGQNIVLAAGDVIGAVIHSRPVGGDKNNRRAMVAVYKIDDSTGLATETILEVEKDYRVDDEFAVDDGYAMGDTMTIQCSGANTELYGAFYAQMSPSARPDVVGVAGFAAVAKRMFCDWAFGHKDIPVAFADPVQAGRRGSGTGPTFGRLTEQNPNGIGHPTRGTRDTMSIQIAGDWTGEVALQVRTPGGGYVNTGISYTANTLSGVNVEGGSYYRLNFETPTSGAPLYSIR